MYAMLDFVILMYQKYKYKNLNEILKINKKSALRNL
jgi:hypothetical protein